METYDHINYLLFTAVQNQDFEQVQTLWDQHDPSVFGADTLLAALIRPSWEIFEFVAERSSNEDISQHIARALEDQQRFEYLLPRADVTYGHSQALSWAAAAGNLPMVRFLIPLSAPQDPKCEALFEALFNEYPDIVNALYPVCNIEATMQQLLDSEYDLQPQIEWLQNKINTEQNRKLRHEVIQGGVGKTRKM